MHGPIFPLAGFFHTWVCYTYAFLYLGSLKHYLGGVGDIPWTNCICSFLPWGSDLSWQERCLLIKLGCPPGCGWHSAWRLSDEWLFLTIMASVLVSLGFYNKKIPKTVWLPDDRSVFLVFAEVEDSVPGHWKIWCLVNTCFFITEGAFLGILA